MSASQIAAVATVITACSVFITAWRTTRSVSQKLDSAVATTAETVQAVAVDTDAKLGEIHTLVNSRLEEALEKIEAQSEKIESLQRRLGDEPTGGVA